MQNDRDDADHTKVPLLFEVKRESKMEEDTGVVVNDMEVEAEEDMEVEAEAVPTYIKLTSVLVFVVFCGLISGLVIVFLPSPSVSFLPSVTSNPTISAFPSFTPTFSSSPTSPLMWNQSGFDIDGLDVGEEIGTAVAISCNGNRLVMGGDGRLRMYDWKAEGNNWSLVSDLSSFVRNYGFGLAISSSGSHVIAGDPSRFGTGAVTVFRQSGSEFARMGQTIEGGATSYSFGWSVDITDSGGMVAVGARDGDYVSLLEWTGDDWKEQHRLEGDSGSWFGHSLSLTSDGSKIVIGASLADENGSYSGSSFIYTLPDVAPIQRLDGDEANDRFGMSVSIAKDGSRVAVGAHEGNYVKVFQHNAADNKYLQIGNEMRGTGLFGVYVALSADGGRLAVGAPWNDEGGSYSGKTSVFAIYKDSWTLIGEFKGESIYDKSGYSVAISAHGERVAIGAPGNDGGGTNSGHVRVYEATGGLQK